MSLLNQIRESNLSKQGKTNPTGRFEGTPSNVGLVRQGVTTPQLSQFIPATQNPVDVTFNNLGTSTYLEYLKSGRKL